MRKVQMAHWKGRLIEQCNLGPSSQPHLMIYFAFLRRITECWHILSQVFPNPVLFEQGMSDLTTQQSLLGSFSVLGLLAASDISSTIFFNYILFDFEYPYKMPHPRNITTDLHELISFLRITSNWKTQDVVLKTL